MWVELTKKQEQEILQKYELYKFHEVYKKHDSNQFCKSCGAVISFLADIPKKYLNVVNIHAALLTIPEDYIIPEVLLQQYNKISIDFLKKHKKISALVSLVFMHEIPEEERVKIIEQCPEIVPEFCGFRNPFLEESIKDKILEIAINNPEIKLNLWCFQSIVNKPWIDISKINNKPSFRKTNLLEFAILRNNIDIAFSRIKEIIEKYGFCKFKVTLF